MTSVFPNHQIPTDGYGAHPTDRGNVATSGYGFPLQVAGLPFWVRAPVTFLTAGLAMSSNPINLVQNLVQLGQLGTAPSTSAPVDATASPIDASPAPVDATDDPVDVTSAPIDAAGSPPEFDRLEPDGPTWSP